MSHATPHNATQRRTIGRRQLRREEPLTPSQSSSVESSSSHGAPAECPYDLSVRINAMLYEVVADYVSSANAGGDYTYTSVACFIREALRDHAQFGKLEARAEGGDKKRLTLRVDDEVKAHYSALPKGKRTEILERAVRTKLLV